MTTSVYCAANLRTARSARGLSRDDLARRMDVTADRIAAWEAGVESPRLDAVVRLARLLDVDPAGLAFAEPGAFRRTLPPGEDPEASW